MKMNNMRRVFLFALTITLLLVSSCKGGGETEIIIPSATNKPQTTAPSNIKTSGELVLPMPENAVRDNPYSVTTEEMLTLYSIVFEALLDIDETGKLVPELAQSWTRDELNANIWIVNLRSNVVWHDGTEFSADDVIYSFSRLKSYLAKEDASEYYSACAQGVESIEKRDDKTLVIKLKSSGYNALYCLTFPVMCKSSEQSYLLNGTGAYKHKESKSKSMTFVINQNWWKEQAHIKQIRFEERLNNETALASYGAGQLNFVPTSNLSAGKYRKDGDTNVLDVMTQDAELLIFNYSNSLFYDMNIRRAISFSIDRSKLITNVFMNRAQTADVPVAPDSWLYSTQYTKLEFNTDKANTLLENAGYRDSDGDGIREKDGNPMNKLSFTLLVNESTDNTARKNAAEQIKDQLLACGIEITVDSRNYTLGDDNSDYLRALYAGEFDIALTGTRLSRNCDVTEFFKADGVLNLGGVSDERLLDEAAAVNSAADETQMREAAYTLQSSFTEKLPFLVLYFRLNSIVYSYDIKGVSGVREPDIMNMLPSWYFE